MTTSSESVVYSRSSTFPPFLRLLKELQTRIWEKGTNAVRPRIVELLNPPGTDYDKPSPASRCPIPSLLHTCYLSQILALQRWTLSFSPETKLPRTYFNFANDILRMFSFPRCDYCPRRHGQILDKATKC